MSNGERMGYYMTAKDVAAFVQLSLQTIRRLTMKKEIPFHKINRSVRYKPDEIKAWVEKREQDKRQAESTMFDNAGGVASTGSAHD